MCKAVLTLSLVIGLIGAFFVPNSNYAQRKQTRTFVTTKKTTTPPKLIPPPPQCITQNTGNEGMTYLVGASKLSNEDKKRIEDSIGTLEIPKNETKRAKKIRADALRKRAEQKSNIEKAYQIWLKKNPNATTEETERIENLLSYYRGKIKWSEGDVNAPKFDWRDHINVGPVMYQGDNCNTCWAFAAINAYQTSLNLSEARFGEPIFLLPEGDFAALASAPPAPERLVPSVQQLLNCMPISQKKICDKGWHGKAFTFMVNKKGVPLSKLAWGQDEIFKPREKGACRADSFTRALTWDYVSSPPDKLPSVEQLKAALIEHGPIAAPLVVDNCLLAYKSGVFNEKTGGYIGHVVLLIGWDDSKEAWLVKNSWGEKWGEKGFGWIKYGSNNIGIFAAWIDATPM